MHTKSNTYAKAVKTIKPQFRFVNGVTKQLGLLQIDAMRYHAGAWERDITHGTHSDSRKLLLAHGSTMSFNYSHHDSLIAARRPTRKLW